MNDAFRKQRKWPKRAAIALAYVSIFGATAATAFFVKDQKVTVVDLRTGSQTTPLTKTERFMANLADSATAGLSVRVTDFKFDQYYTKTIDDKVVEDTDKGHNTISNYVDGDGNKAPISLALKLDSLSLHGINFTLDAPLAYSNNGNDIKNRGLHLSLLNETPTEAGLYVNLFDNGNESFHTDEDENVIVEKTLGGSWDFKYQIGISPKEKFVEVDDGQGGTVLVPSYDPLTHGQEYFEYGDLDEMLDIILQALSDNNISLSFEGWLGKLTGSASSEEEASSQEEPQEDQPTAGISVDDIMDSMSEMTDVWSDKENEGYFVWELPLGDKVLPLGLQSDANMNLCAVDLPAKVAKYGNAWKIKDGMELSAHAEISGTLPTSWAATVPGNKADYHKLSDSTDLFKRVATLATKPEIEIDADLEIGHNKEAVEGSRTVLKQDSASESMVLGIHGKLDAYDDEAGAYGFEGMSLGLTVDKKRAENEAFNGHKVDVAYGRNEDGAFEGFLNLNDVLKAKTTKAYLDEFIEVIKEAFSSDSEEAAEEGSSFDIHSLDKFLDLLGDSVQAVRNSKLIKAIESGAYSPLLDFIKSIEGKDNLIKITLDLSLAGVEGEIIVSLDATEESHGLAAIDFKDVSFASFSIDGSLAVNETSDPTIELPEGEYQTLTHMKGLVGQIGEIVSEKSVQAKLSGALHDGEETKMAIDGDIAFDFDSDHEDRFGRVGISIEHPIGDKKQLHNVKLGLQDEFDTVAFTYDSIAEDTETYYSQKTDKKVAGKLSLNSAKEVLGEALDLDALLKGFIGGDDRYSRLAAALAGAESESLLSSILGGQYFDLLDNKHIISSIDLGGAKTEVTVDGGALGLDGVKIVLDLTYTGEEGLKFNGENALDSLDVIVKKDNETKFDFHINELSPLKENNHVPAFASTEGFDDLEPAVSLVSELVNTVAMGYALDSGNTFHSRSDYQIRGDISLDIAGYATNVYGFDAYAAVEGAETKIQADFKDLPVIRGVNAPDDSTYFRPNELEGKRDSSILFYANGLDPEGELLLTRNSSYGRIKDVQDAVRVDGKDFTDDFLNWVLLYTLGVNEELLNKEESAEPVEEAEETSSTGWNPIAKGIFIADAWNGFKAVNSEDGHSTTYTLGLDLGVLLNIGLLGDASIVLTSRDLSRGEYKARCLTDLSVVADARAKAASSNKVAKILNVRIDLSLVNFGTAENGYSEILEVLGEGTDYATSFVGNVPDSGLLEGVTGELYNLVDGFQSEDPADPGYFIYGHNLLEAETRSASNFYLL